MKKHSDGNRSNKFSVRIFQSILLFLIILTGAYFRFVGINWDQNYHLHPDERFLTMVESSISPIRSLQEYFDTEHSQLNPHNHGYSFFVYGTFPIFLVRYVGQWLGQTGYGQIHLVGRALSGLADLVTVICVYFIALLLYKNRWIGLITAALASFSVLPIQTAHYFTVDSFTNLFVTLAILFSACILILNRRDSGSFKSIKNADLALLTNWNGFLFYGLFGVATGLAAASKINSIVVAAMLPLAAFLKEPKILFYHKDDQWKFIVRNLIVAGVVCFIVFRIFQPYAFEGPGFFNLSLNPKWIANLKELNYLSSGDSNYPPSLQWARRSIWFGLQNMMTWGLGLPFGLFACLSFIWMGLKIAKGEWKTHILLWIWTGTYFIWQSLRWNPTMRYFLPVYPTLAVITAWGLWQVWEKGKTSVSSLKLIINWKKIGTVLLILVIAGTFAWSFAFTRIYTRPVTRVSASDWIYRNIEGAINLIGENKDQKISIPLSFPRFFIFDDSNSLSIQFFPYQNSKLLGIQFDHIVDLSNSQDKKSLNIAIFSKNNLDQVLASGSVINEFTIGDDPQGGAYQILFENPLDLDQNVRYLVQIYLSGAESQLRLNGYITLLLDFNGKIINQTLFESAGLLQPDIDYSIPFTPFISGSLNQIDFFRIMDLNGGHDVKKIQAAIFIADANETPLATAELSDTFTDPIDYRGQNKKILLSNPVEIVSGRSYYLNLKIVEGQDPFAVYGSLQANETSWDDSIPFSMYGYDPFSYDSGVYQSDLNLEVYWDDNEQKLQRFISILDHADYIFITSNRQWGSIIQIPEKYPLTNIYYRLLIGCPGEKDVQWCYRIAQPGMFKGGLGFTLIKVFDSMPNLGSIKFNTQFAEEAFTVYDHPKVFIFKKNEDFSLERIRLLFSQVDLSKVINLTPAQANHTPGNLQMTEGVKQLQYSGGTWSDLFDRNDLKNQNQVLGLILWYGLMTLLGWIVYPTVRIALGGLQDKGYPLIKISGLILLALPVWLAGSFGILFTKPTIFCVVILLVLFNLFLFLKQKDQILAEIKAKYKYFLWVEIIALAFFIIFLLIRIGNPDLWHPYKGGEKPMDFSYFNAVLKSSVFPPYDPWFSGGYINYYYYGFVIAGVPLKLLGLVPSFAYNLILPSFFCFTAMGAFCLGWNIVELIPKNKSNRKKNLRGNNVLSIFNNPYLIALGTAIILLILGNLGTLRMIFHGFQRISSGGVPIESGSFIQRIIWTISGLLSFMGGAKFNFYPGDWYWIPSRALPGEAITEFPFFTFLYGDTHAHLFALPLTLLVLAWCLSVYFLDQDWFDKTKIFFSCIIFLFGGVALGALKPTNTWDYPTYLGICVIILFYSTYRYSSSIKIFSFLPPNWRKFIYGMIIVLIVIAISFLLYQPFNHWFGQAYSAIGLWNGDHSPIFSYLTHWGLFLFIICSWLFWNIRSWMAETPFSTLKKFIPYRNLILRTIILVLLGIFLLLFIGVEIAIIAVPILITLFLLLLRNNQTKLNRFFVFTASLGLFLTLLVEIVVLKGDIGRMNTVFKFYLQSWTLLSVSSAYFLCDIFKVVFTEWKAKWRNGWLMIMIFLIMSAALFAIFATIDKVTDRMAKNVPLTLDGMKYMEYSQYIEENTTMNLDQDYHAILWTQENVTGSPTIVEANVPEYQWGNRFTVYTGLPGVVGWNWHQRQQKAILPSTWVTDRIDEIRKFYLTQNKDQVLDFIKKYQINYIIVGQLEKIIYPGEGLDKFKALDGIYWNSVYQDLDTAIYKVNDSVLQQ